MQKFTAMLLSFAALAGLTIGLVGCNNTPTKKVEEKKVTVTEKDKMPDGKKTETTTETKKETNK